MKMLVFCFLTAVLIWPALLPGQGEKDLDESALKSLHDRLIVTTEFKALQAALQNSQPGEVFLNREVLKNHNTHYSIEIETPVITNQKGTGRCWLYAALNTIRPQVAKRLGVNDFEFSTGYYFFLDKLEKANAFLQRMLDNARLPIRDFRVQKLLESPCDDGGYWQNAVDLVAKYGAVPLEAMPEVAAGENSSSMNRALTLVLRQGAYHLRSLMNNGVDPKELDRAKQTVMDQVYRILVLHLGAPVTQFPFRYREKKEKGETQLTEYKTYTAKEFAKNFIKEDLGEFVMFAHWPARPFGKYYSCEYSSNLYSGTPLNFVNLPMDDIKSMILTSLKAGETVNFSSDVGKQLDSKRGIMHPQMYRNADAYGVDLSLDKKRDSVLRNINSTHAMVICGVDLINGSPLKWKVENSWGSDKGSKGFYAMYDGWMDLYVVRVVINKKYVPPKLLALFDTPPQLIPFTEPEQ